MALIAVVAGYVCRFRWYTNAAVVAGAVVLGYIFNLLRLCVLVLYYIVALHLPSLKDKAETADYIIGAGLFLLASFLLFAVIHRLRERDHVAETPLPEQTLQRTAMPLAPAAAIAIIACVAGVAFASSLNQDAILIRSAAQRFPAAIGNYTLIRTWEERLDTGVVIYQWAAYARDGGSPIAIGISPEFGWHDPLICHTIRGEHPVRQGPLGVQTDDGTVNFNSAEYFDGETHVFEASTQCSGGNCNEFATSRTRFGLIYTRLDEDSLVRAPARSLPVVVRAELPDQNLTTEAAQAKLSSSVTSFVSAISLTDLTRP